MPLFSLYTRYSVTAEHLSLDRVSGVVGPSAPALSLFNRFKSTTELFVPKQIAVTCVASAEGIWGKCWSEGLFFLRRCDAGKTIFKSLHFQS